MQTSTRDQIRRTVRQANGAPATRRSCCNGPGCCGPAGSTSRQHGYSEDDLASVPDGADLGLGGGTPQAIEGVRRWAERNNTVSPVACCDTVVREACCEPADKPTCCGVSPDAATCGCQTGSR